MTELEALNQIAGDLRTIMMCTVIFASISLGLMIARFINDFKE